ncbi:MAG: ATP-binding cassette domain-containing protein [Dehalococcoidia bacterium]|nr:MAG: ATP-binding cassette domain-containing protein [Dehalococcoidia bacterium]
MFDSTAATLDAATTTPAPLLRVRGLHKHFVRGRSLFGATQKRVRAVDGVDLEVQRGETLGIVGESGCGKTTTGRVLVGLEEPTAGDVLLEGTNYFDTAATVKAYRRRVQMVFQDPMASLDPRMTVGTSIAEPLTVQKIGTRADRRERVSALLQQVGLTAEMADRFPSQFSGGQRQRLGIARALAVAPDVVVADEPTSALDVSVRAQVVNLLRDLQDQLGVAYVFISHDLSTVRFISDRIAVMYLGKIMEDAPAEELFARPQHPYTRALLSAIPIPDPTREAQRERLLLEGDLPSPSNPPTGCRFNTRCPIATDRCREEEPMLDAKAPGHRVACHFV